MKFFEEQRSNLAGKIQKKILKNSELDNSFSNSGRIGLFYEIEPELGAAQQVNNINNRGGNNRIVHRQAPRRGRGGRIGRIPPGFQQPREQAPRLEQDENNIQNDRRRERRDEQEQVAYIPPNERNNQDEEREELQMNENLNEERNEREEETKISDESSSSKLNNQVEEKPRNIDVDNSEVVEKEIVGVQFSNYTKMVLKLFEFLQNQDQYLQIEAQQIEVEEKNLFEQQNLIQNALEISLLLEAHRRKVVNEVVEILIIIKNYSSLLESLQHIFGDKLKDVINQTILENDLILQDLLCYFAIYQIFKENASDSQKELYALQENTLKQKIGFILNLYEQKVYTEDKHFTQFFEQLPEFMLQNIYDSSKSYQILATFMSVYTQNIDGIQVKNTDIYLQNVFTNNSWKLAQNSIQKLLGSLDRIVEFSQRLSNHEGSLIFNLHSNISPIEGIIQIKCFNLLQFSEFRSDKSIFTDQQITNFKKYIHKEQSRISAKQQKSISEYADENYKIKFFFEDGLKLKQYLLQNEFFSVDVYNLPPNLRSQDLQEILSTDLQNQVIVTVSKSDSQGKNYYELTFGDKLSAKQFIDKISEFQIMFNQEFVTIRPHLTPELQSVNTQYSIDIQIAKNTELNYILTQLRNKDYYQNIKKQQMFQQIQNYLKIKSANNFCDLASFKTSSLFEIQNLLQNLKNEQVEEIFGIKLFYQCHYSTSVNVQKMIYDQFQVQFASIKNFKNNNINVMCQEYTKNSKEIQITLSSSNLNYLKKVLSALNKVIRPIRHIALESNKQKEVFFREDFIKASRKKFTRPSFYTFFSTINMRFEFYHENQFNFTFFNNISNSEHFIPYEVNEKVVENIEKDMQTFQNNLNSYNIKQSYYVHPSLQNEFLEFIKEKGISKFSQNDKIFELEFPLGIFLLLNKQIMSQFVKASYLKKNEEIFKTKQSSKQKGSEQEEMPFCKVCYDSDHIFFLSNCSCRNYCRDCLREQIQIEIQENQVQFKGIIYCPLCKQAPISLKDFSKLFNLYEIQAIMSQWVKCITYNYRNSSGQKQFAHCIYPKCQGIILIPSDLKQFSIMNQNDLEMEIETEQKSLKQNDEIETENNQNSSDYSSSIVCQQCNNALCSSSIFDSKIPYHSAHESSISCMDQYNQQRGEMPSNAKYCPSCSQVYFHETGCNHLTCYQCGEHFCSICNKNFGKTQGDIYTHIQECEQKQSQQTAQQNAEEPEQQVEQPPIDPQQLNEQELVQEQAAEQAWNDEQMNQEANQEW
ncbi:hypothetical protein ABPG72_009367 [Tetrahymena utriculariae]